MTASPVEDRDAFGRAAARVRAGADAVAEAAALVAVMTLAEKLDCLDGDTDFWSGIEDMTTGGYHRHPWPAAVVDRLGIPGLAFADGPRGCVIDPATCFPVAMARGATFDPGLERRIGDAIGAELRARGATHTGAVCINLLRHPGWGRAQETYGEDPHHVGEMGAAFVAGLQGHVMACAKHFALNSMENARFTVDVRVDERALHEVYLPHFRRVVEAGVASIMSAYNSVNGHWCGEHRVLLNDILRDEWGFHGFVISDFVFGLRDPVASVKGGLDIEMPFRQQRAQVLAGALAGGELADSAVDASVTRTVATLLRFADLLDAPSERIEIAGPAHRALAREAAIRSTVLVHNEDGFLPVDPDAIGRVAVLGRLAAVPNLGDGGSSSVRPPETVTLLDGIRSGFPSAEVVFDERSVTVARGADLAVVVVGYTEVDEGEFLDDEATAALAHLFPPPPTTPSSPSDGAASPERDGVGSVPADGAPAPERDAVGSVPDDQAPEAQGFVSGGDRRSLRLRPADEELIAAAGAECDRVVVVVMAGSAVVMPWLERTAATVMVWYPGMEGGHALADVLSGRAEPGGRLPFAVPADEHDLVAFDPDATEVTYGLLHGQWWLDDRGIEAHLPFGWGLGYTNWQLGSPVVTMDPESTVGRIDVEVTNTGGRDGSEVVMVFAGLADSTHERPERRLVGFERVWADAGASAAVAVPFDLATLAVRIDGGWLQEPGEYELTVARHAHDPSAVPLTVTL